MKTDRTGPMRCRVSQTWASKGWGGMVIPRIGMEVIVEFLEGDPDKPLVTGCVYNGKNDVPYPLPANKTRSTFKTDTHQGKGFNELRFEDQNGREEIFIQAERDRVDFTKMRRMEHVGLSERKAVRLNRHHDIGNNDTSVIGSDLKISVGRRSALASVAQSLAFSGLKSAGATFPISTARDAVEALANPKMDKGNMRLSVASNRVSVIGKADHLQVGSGRSVTVGGTQSEIIDGSDESLITGNRFQTVRGRTWIISDENMTLECGKSRIEVNPNGTIRIVGTRIELTADSDIVGNASRVNWN